MNRRSFLPNALAAGAAVAALPHTLLAETDGAKPGEKSLAARGRGLQARPEFRALSFEGKRLVEYSQPLLRKVPQPGQGMLRQWLLSFDTLEPRRQQALRRLLDYIEYMHEQELTAYLASHASEEAANRRKAMKSALIALSREPRIPYYTGPKLVVVSFGPWTSPDPSMARPDERVLPHIARDLLPKGTWYPHVRADATALPMWSNVVAHGVLGPWANAAAATAGEQTTADTAWCVFGEGAIPAEDMGPAAGAYALTTALAHDIDAYLDAHGIKDRIRMARTPEARRALRAEIAAFRDRAMADLGLADRFPTEPAQDFVGQVLFKERGIKDRGNTFVHVSGLRAMQLVHPRVLYVQFGPPDNGLRRDGQGGAFGEQAAVGRGHYAHRDYLADLDQWSYYHWLEAQQHPHYAGEATFVLLCGPRPGGETHALVAGPGVQSGKVARRGRPLADILAAATAQVA